LMTGAPTPDLAALEGLLALILAGLADDARPDLLAAVQASLQGLEALTALVHEDSRPGWPR
jgi:hypothetical protein